MNAFLMGLRNLGPVKLAALGVVAAAMIGGFLYLGNRISAPNYGLLYSDLDLKDSAQVVQKLEALGVPFQLRGDGAQILVPAEQVGRLRMAMAEGGLPRGGSIGYEIFDKSETLGTTSFVQNVNHVRALEGELSRTISTLGSVQGARVHLVLPRRELFARERQDPSASIAVKLRGAERLGKGQVAAIQHLVAAAVPGLKPNRISIVDGDGNLLARGGGEGAGDVGGLNSDEQRTGYEQRLGRTVEEMLERSLGVGKVRVEIRADMDFDRVTTSTESFDPEGQVVRSTQTVSESGDTSEGGDQSVTVANNLPDAQKQNGTGGSAGRAKNSRNEETINYEITKTVKSHVREAGTVRRLSVAVLVDGIYAVGSDGTRAYQPRPPEELQQLSTLVRSAIGFNQQRGDTVEVVNLRFAGNQEDLVAEIPYSLLGLGKADLFRIGETLVLTIVGLLALLLVVRPFLARLADNAPAFAGGTIEQRLLENQGTPTAALPPPGGSLVPAGPGMQATAVEGIDSMIDLSQVEGRVKGSSIKKIGEIVDKHPDETVAILRSWMYQSN